MRGEQRLELKGSFVDVMDKYLHWIIVAFAWIWVKIHDLVVAIGLGSGGAGWVVSIVILTLLVRLAILPLYLKQIKSSRNMQALQPQLQKIQAKYKGKTDPVSRQRLSEETMALYKKEGASPFASCLPALVQMPILFALYRVIYAVVALQAGTYMYDNLGPLTPSMAQQMYNSSFMGVSLFDSLSTTPGALKLVFVFLIIVMVGFQFLTMRMSMMRNMPAQSDPNNPMIRSQKMMMYLMPAMFIFTGLVFMMALLVYMVTTTLFSWAQQFAVIKLMPTPGSPAYAELVAKRQSRYQAWAKPLVDEFRNDADGLEVGSPEYLTLETETLAELEKRGKSSRIYDEFPESWTVGDKLSVYRKLATDDWTVLPDANWMKGLVAARRAVKDSSSRQSRQPKKLTKEQRARRAEQERLAKERNNSAPKKKKPGSELSPEEIERRRQRRRAEQRKRGNSGKKG